MNEIIGPIYYVMASDPRQVHKRSLFLLKKDSLLNFDDNLR